jgi:DNA gyrase/topoisomerase IV subunit B
MDNKYNAESIKVLEGLEGLEKDPVCILVAREKRGYTRCFMNC